jgi:putative acetyltransferase
MEIVSDCAALADDIAGMTAAAFAQAFGSGDGEARLIAALRADGDVIVELAAFEGDEVVGHILFSRVTADPPNTKVAALAPMCAKISHQKRGIGSVLVRAGLERCRARGIEAIIVLGDNDYYGRFGFSAALASNVACDYAGPHFQALEFEPGALRGIKRVSYAPAFSAAGM